MESRRVPAHFLGLELEPRWLIAQRHNLSVWHITDLYEGAAFIFTDGSAHPFRLYAHSPKEGKAVDEARKVLAQHLGRSAP